jgi:hypothetical protein
MSFVPTTLRSRILRADEGQFLPEMPSCTDYVVNGLKTLGNYTGSNACGCDPYCRMECSRSKTNAESEEYDRGNAVRDQRSSCEVRRKES